MLLGIIAILYFVLAIWSIWFSKKKSKTVAARIIYTFLVFIFIILLSSFTFWPKTSLYVKSFPLNLDREYVETIELEEYVIVVYTPDSGESYGFETFYKYIGGYIESTQPRVSFHSFKGPINDQYFGFSYVIIDDVVYALLFNDDLVNYQSLIIEDQIIDLNLDLSQKYTLVPLENRIFEIKTVTLDNIEYNVMEIE